MLAMHIAPFELRISNNLIYRLRKAASTDLPNFCDQSELNTKWYNHNYKTTSIFTDLDRNLETAYISGDFKCNYETAYISTDFNRICKIAYISGDFNRVSYIIANFNRNCKLAYISDRKLIQANYVHFPTHYRRNSPGSGEIRREYLSYWLITIKTLSHTEIPLKYRSELHISIDFNGNCKSAEYAWNFDRKSCILTDFNHNYKVACIPWGF